MMIIMGTNRTLEELYTMLHQSFKERVYGKGPQFICCLIHELASDEVINAAEYDLLIHNFKRNRPTPELHEIFCNHNMYSRTCYNWFGNGKQSYEARTAFLQHLIKNHIV